MMQDSDSVEDLARCMTDLIESCSIKEFSTKSLTYFDIEYLFLKIRSKSVGETTKINFRCNNIVEEQTCGAINEVEINLEDVAVSFENSISNEIQINDNLYMKLRYPNVTSAKFLELYNTTKDLDYLIKSISEDLESIMDSEKMYDDFNDDELKEFLNSMDLNTFKKILEFYINTPKLTKDIEFTCKKCKYNEMIVLSGLSDFFV
jgi:hypothetical protein